MRLIAMGDKSRYQFLRSIAEAGGNGNFSFGTEQLGTRTICIVPDRGKISEDVFYSSKLPLSTELVFPAEVDKSRFACKANDKILWFDEFPYRTSEEIDSLEKYLWEYDVLFCEIVLVDNNRKLMESDISTETMALEEAYEQYRTACFPVHKYVLGENCDFLFWNCDNYINTDIIRFHRRLEQLKDDIELLFELDYELEYTKELKAYISNPRVLDYFFQYNKDKMKEDATRYYLDNAAEHFLKAKDSKCTSFAKEIYIKYMKCICVWDLQRDLEILEKDILSAYDSFFKYMSMLAYSGAGDLYEDWLYENRNQIINIKRRIVDFFEMELCQVLKKRIMGRIKKLEELLDEENS